MISVSDALSRLFDLVGPTACETIPLGEASGRVLARDAIARRDQPPFAASAMDGYALAQTDARPGARLRVIGEAAAGHAFAGTVGPGEAVRIFTGAPLPPGSDRIVIQEDVTRDGDIVELGAALDAAHFVRPAGGDFKSGDRMAAPRRLSPSDITLLAAMNQPEVTVYRRPRIAIIATGDELVTVGETARADQIIASNGLGLKAMLDGDGALCRLLPIARDTMGSLSSVLALADDADLILTIGGASVGDHDLLGTRAGELGLSRDFYRVAMRPGKPLMAGRMRGTPLIGLPGNPVSSMVCGTIFVQPMIQRMLGGPSTPRPRETARLAHPVEANGAREHYMRAKLDAGRVTIPSRQDSSLISVLSDANALAIRPPHAPATEAGSEIEIIRL